MARVRMIMPAMITGVIVGMGRRVSCMIVGMLVFVNMIVVMGMGMFMSVLRVPVSVLMSMGVCVFVSVNVRVFVVALHGIPPMVVR